MFQFIWEAMERSTRGGSSVRQVYWWFTGADPCFSLVRKPWSAAAGGAALCVKFTGGLLGPILVSVYWGGHGAQQQGGSIVRQVYWWFTGSDPCFNLLERPWSAAAGWAAVCGKFTWSLRGAILVSVYLGLLGRPWSAAAGGVAVCGKFTGGLLVPILV